jgi:hypothetical protein
MIIRKIGGRGGGASEVPRAAVRCDAAVGDGYHSVGRALHRDDDRAVRLQGGLSYRSNSGPRVWRGGDLRDHRQHEQRSRPI